MHSHAEFRLALVLTATVAGCDVDESPPAGAGETTDAAVPPFRDSLEYEGREDRDDVAVLNDRSNLKREELSPLEYRRWLSRRERDELLREVERAKLPTEEEIASVSIWWFSTGTGIAIKNPTERPFTASAYFSATAGQTCGVAVPLRPVAPGGSAMLSPLEATDCAIDRADVILTDEYGFLVNAITVEAEERKP